MGVVAQVRMERPADYLKVCASLLPRQLQAETMSVVRAEDLSDDELATIASRGLKKEPETNGPAPRSCSSLIRTTNGWLPLLR